MTVQGSNSINNKQKFCDKISRQKSPDVFKKHCVLQPVLLSDGLAFDKCWDRNYFNWSKKSFSFHAIMNNNPIDSSSRREFFYLSIKMIFSCEVLVMVLGGSKGYDLVGNVYNLIKIYCM